MKNKPSIYFCGDVHGKFDHIIHLCKEEPPDAIILLGDIQAQRPLHKELANLNQRTLIWWIHGNHDTDTQREHDHLFGSELTDRNLHGCVELTRFDGHLIVMKEGVQDAQSKASVSGAISPANDRFSRHWAQPT